MERIKGVNATKDESLEYAPLPNAAPDIQTHTGLKIEPLETLVSPQDNEDAEGHEFNPAIALSRAYIDPNKPEPEPEIVISIQEARFATLGNFSTVIGKAKSGKSFFNSLVVSAVSGGQIAGIEGGLMTAIFDTEQARSDAQIVYVNRVKNLGGNAAKIKLFSIKALSPMERVQTIEYFIQNNPDFKLIIIDGIRDLLTDINSPDQSTELATWLMKLLDEYNIHIMTVLHQNKGDNNARGHIGTELTNKAESVISVTKNTDEVIVCSAEYTRAKPFLDIAFSIDEKGLPLIIDDYKPQTLEDKRKAKRMLTPSDFDLNTHAEIAKAVFNGLPLKYEDVWRKIKLRFEDKQNKKIGDNKAKDFLTFWIDEGIVLKKENARIYEYNTNYDNETLF